jgi:hypothetical protein
MITGLTPKWIMQHIIIGMTLSQHGKFMSI